MLTLIRHMFCLGAAHIPIIHHGGPEANVLITLMLSLYIEHHDVEGKNVIVGVEAEIFSHTLLAWKGCLPTGCLRIHVAPKILCL